MKCSVCNRLYHADCDWHQGRCPHHPSVWQQIVRWWNRRKQIKGKNETTMG